jgi:hypothetical protein
VPAVFNAYELVEAKAVSVELERLLVYLVPAVGE